MPSKTKVRLTFEDRAFRVCKPGDEDTYPELAKLLIAYGQACWSWTRAEDSLFLLFAHVAEPNIANNTKALRAAFFSIMSPHGRLDMINAVINATWDETRIKDWTPLYLEIKKQVAVRGRLAHLVGHSYELKPRSRRAVMMEPIHNPRTKKTHAEANSLEFTAERMNELARSWGNLHDRLHVFTGLVSLQNKPEADAKSVAHLRQWLADPNSQIHQKSSAPSKSSQVKAPKAP